MGTHDPSLSSSRGGRRGRREKTNFNLQTFPRRRRPNMARAEGRKKKERRGRGKDRREQRWKKKRPNGKQERETDDTS